MFALFWLDLNAFEQQANAIEDLRNCIVLYHGPIPTHQPASTLCTVAVATETLKEFPALGNCEKQFKNRQTHASSCFTQNPLHSAAHWIQFPGCRHAMQVVNSSHPMVNAWLAVIF